jgi:hypothetical protein
VVQRAGGGRDIPLYRRDAAPVDLERGGAKLPALLTWVGARHCGVTLVDPDARLAEGIDVDLRLPLDPAADEPGRCSGRVSERVTDAAGRAVFVLALQRPPSAYRRSVQYWSLRAR